MFIAREKLRKQALARSRMRLLDLQILSSKYQHRPEKVADIGEDIKAEQEIINRIQAIDLMYRGR